MAGIWPLVARGGRAIRTLVAYGAGVAVAYPILGVSFFSWYIIPPVVMLLGWGFAAGAGGVAGTPGRRRPPPGPPVARPALAALAAAAVLVLPCWTYRP